MALRFSSLPHARRYVYRCLAQSLSNDLGSGVLFDDGLSKRDQTRVERAAQQVIDELERKAQPPRRG